MRTADQTATTRPAPTAAPAAAHRPPAGTLTRAGVAGPMALVALAILSGCASTAPHDTAVAGGSCYTQGQGVRQRSTCTQAAVPGVEQAQALRQLPADPQRLTVVLVRRHWADTRERVNVSVAGAELQTVPQSFAVLQLPPGEHVIGARWSGGQTLLTVQGQAGQVLAVDLHGQAIAGHSRFSLAPLDLQRATQDVAQALFVGLARPGPAGLGLPVRAGRPVQAGSAGAGAARP